MEEFRIDFSRLSQVYPQIGKGDEHSTHVLVIYGGLSAEADVSRMSAKVVLDHLANMDYRVTPVDMGTDVAEVIRNIKPDVIFNALHGTFGEDGCVPGMLEILGIPYTHSGVLASSIALDKILSQQIFASNGIKCPKRIIVKKGHDLSKEPMPRPFVIKPTNQGSSLGVEVIFKEDDYNLADYSFTYGDTIIIEEYIKGKEIQVAVLNDKAVGTLELVCLQGKRFNDYDCKYKEGFSKHISPAGIPKDAEKTIMKTAEKVHKLLNCKGVTRAEFIYNIEEDQAYFIELNTHPGLTLLSSAPDIIVNNGIKFEEFLDILLKEALEK